MVIYGIVTNVFLKSGSNTKEASPTPSQGKLAAIADGGQCGPDRLGQ
jgi:hypothetical protein